jgi:hypothetical protein
MIMEFVKEPTIARAPPKGFILAAADCVVAAEADCVVVAEASSVSLNSPYRAANKASVVGIKPAAAFSRREGAYPCNLEVTWGAAPRGCSAPALLNIEKAPIAKSE